MVQSSHLPLPLCSGLTSLRGKNFTLDWKMVNERLLWDSKGVTSSWKGHTEFLGQKYKGFYFTLVDISGKDILFGIYTYMSLL